MKPTDIKTQPIKWAMILSRTYNAIIMALITSLVFSGTTHAGIFDGFVSFGCSIYKELTGTVAMMLIALTLTFAVVMQLVGESRGIFSSIAKVLVWGSILVTLGTFIVLAIPAYKLPPACA